MLGAALQDHQGSVRRPDWRRSADYSDLLDADRSAFAWEWLRRTAAYRQVWRDFRRDPVHSSSAAGAFALARFEDPDLAVPHARPIWLASVDPHVISAQVADLFARKADRLDLFKLRSLSSVAVSDEHEHLLLSDGLCFLRVDIERGTLIGNPASLRFAIQGFRQLHPQLVAIERLAALSATGTIPRESGARSRHARWILELRVADALLAREAQQSIARELFAPLISEARWRLHGEAGRKRVQRLCRAAAEHLSHPVHPRWFGRVEAGRTR